MAGVLHWAFLSVMLAIAEHLERVVVSGVARLPSALQRLLAGGRAVRIDGLELEPEVQLMLSLLRLSGHRGLDAMTPAAARVQIDRDALVFAGRPTPVARVEDRSIPGPAGALDARLYLPRPDGPPGGLLVYYHGGGWVVGSLRSHDPVCRFLAHEANVAVLAVDYRCAPEHRFPAAVDDAFAAFRWAVCEARALGADATRVAVGGDSAGGNLAAVVAQLAARDGGARPAAQLLIYPVTDVSRKHASYRLFAEGFFLTEKEMDWYRGHYLPHVSAAFDPRASPLLAPDLRGLPPALVLTAGFDVLRDEGEAYARRMEGAGVPVTLHRHAGLIHGFCNATGVSRPARAAVREAATWLAAQLTPAAQGAAGKRVTRDVDPSALPDLLDHPARATVAFVAGGAVTLLPARARLSAGTHLFAVVAAAGPDLGGREVVLVIDDGPYWFELRGISVRGVAARAGAPEPGEADSLVWYAVEPRRVLAWDYSTIREA